MKNKYKTKKHFSTFLAAATFCFVIFSISSCSFFMENEIPQEEAQQNEISQQGGATNPSDKEALTLKINPTFGNNSSGSSRSAYPSFTATELEAFSYTVVSNSISETVGFYDATDGTISFEIYCGTFTTETITVYAKDNETPQHILWVGTTSFAYSSMGANITDEINFFPYTGTISEPYTPPNGFVDLTLTTSTNYNINCIVKNSSDEIVSGIAADNKPITITKSSNTCHLQTGTNGIAYDTYEVYIYVYHDDDNETIFEYQHQTINIWPGLTTNKWYLSNGQKNTNYGIPVNTGIVKFYVKGTSPTGLYDGGVTLPASYTPKGTILAPFEHLQDALDRCKVSTVDYKIILSGTDTSNTLIDSTSSIAAKSILIEGASSSGNDILDGNLNGTTFKILKNLKITLKNIKITNGSEGGLYYHSSGGNSPITLGQGTVITTNTNSTNGGGIFSQGKIIIDGATISQNTADLGGGIYAAGHPIEMLSGTITDNTASNSSDDIDACGGGGVFVSQTSFTMTGGTIQGNTAVKSGGGIFLTEAYFYMSGSAVIGDNSKNTVPDADSETTNFAGDVGGGIYSSQSVIKLGYLDDTTIAEEFNGGIYYNYAVNNGGGIYGLDNGNTVTLTMVKGNICYNTTGGSGGGINLKQTDADLSSGLIAENNGTDAGAIYLEEGSNLNLSASISIPIGSLGKNYIKYTSTTDKQIIIKGKLEPPTEAGGTTATIAPASYTIGNTVFDLATSPVPETTLEEAAEAINLANIRYYLDTAATIRSGTKVTSTNLDYVFNSIASGSGTYNLIMFGNVDATYKSNLITKIKTITSTSTNLQLDFSKITNEATTNTRLNLGRYSLYQCNRVTKLTFDYNTCELGDCLFCNYVGGSTVGGNTSFTEIKIISTNRSINTDSFKSNTFLNTHLTTIDLTEFTQTVKLQCDYYNTSSDGTNSYLTTIKFGTTIGTGSIITGSAKFTNNNFKFTVNADKSYITTAIIRCTGTTKDPLRLQCNNGNLKWGQYSSWENE